jgi:excisionase family DNA binding protein
MGKQHTDIELKSISRVEVKVEHGLLTSAQVCAYLAISTVTLWKWRKEGKINAYRLPNEELRFRMADVKALLVPTKADLLSPG